MSTWIESLKALLNIFSKVADYFVNRQLLRAGRDSQKAADLTVELEAIEDAKETSNTIDAMSDDELREWMREHLKR